LRELRSDGLETRRSRVRLPEAALVPVHFSSMLVELSVVEQGYQAVLAPTAMGWSRCRTGLLS